MTLPSSGPITINDVNIETGRGSGTTTGIDWIKDNTKDTATSLTQLYNRAYYQSNMNGNCNDGNCAAPASSGDTQCQNCTLSVLANCVNCDTQNWLQNNCNCACTYNCTQNTDQTFNCAPVNCNCDCFVCACACW